MRAEPAVERTAHFLRTRHTAARRPPVDVEQLALAIGLSVRYLPIAESGRFRSNGSAAEAIVNSNDNDERRRFSLAHEISHWLIAGPELDLALRNALVDSYESEEYLCDKLAAAILLPRPWLHHFRNYDRSWATLTRVSGHAEVSLSAALVRLRDVLGWRLSLLQWIRYRGQWVLDGEAGLLPEQHSLIRTISATRYELDALAAGRGSCGQLTVGVGAEELVLCGEIQIRRSDGRVLLLAELPSRGFQRARLAPARYS